MVPQELRIHAHPTFQQSRLVLGFSGWMDGGEVSTGTIEWLGRKLHASLLAEIDSEDFYIFSFPGSMEVSALFRPYTKIKDGLITAYQGPTNRFFHNQEQNLILFAGKEPNFNWRQYAECILSLASQFDVRMIYFIGSVAGLVPHTREPRLFSSVSEPGLKGGLQELGIRFTDYEGPASLVTYLTQLCRERNLPMATLVAEIPAYVQGRNHRCIEAVARKLAGILKLQVNLDDLRALGDRLEERITEIVQQNGELQERIRKLEDDYDNEVFDTQMGDLKDWLEQRGIQAD